MNIRVRAPNDSSVAVMTAVHGVNAFTPNFLSRIFGSDYVMTFIRPSIEMTTKMVEVSRANITNLNTKDHPCTSELDEASLENPGIVMSPEGAKTVEQCVRDYYHRNLSCYLPWGKSKLKVACFYFFAHFVYVDNPMDGILPSCSTKEQYSQYKKLVLALDKAVSTSFWNLVNCTPRCTYTKYTAHVLSESNFDMIKYASGGKMDDGANLHVSLSQHICMYWHCVHSIPVSICCHFN